jgi:hypothetical protein
MFDTRWARKRATEQKQARANGSSSQRGGLAPLVEDHANEASAFVEERLANFIDNRLESSSLSPNSVDRMRRLRSELNMSILGENPPPPLPSPSRSRPGRWACSECGVRNNGDSSGECRVCGAWLCVDCGSRNSRDTQACAGCGEWQCHACSAVNAHDAVRCSGCGLWRCPECDALNEANERVCSKCGSWSCPRCKAPNEGGGASSTPSCPSCGCFLWDCPLCGNRNNVSRDPSLFIVTEECERCSCWACPKCVHFNSGDSRECKRCARRAASRAKTVEGSATARSTPRVPPRPPSPQHCTSATVGGPTKIADSYRPLPTEQRFLDKLEALMMTPGPDPETTLSQADRHPRKPRIQACGRSRMEGPDPTHPLLQPRQTSATAGTAVVRPATIPWVPSGAALQGSWHRIPAARVHPTSHLGRARTKMRSPAQNHAQNPTYQTDVMFDSAVEI